MREIFYIEQERRGSAMADRDDDAPPVPMEDRLSGGFEPMDFPDRECVPVVRRRSRAEVRAMLRD